MKRIYTCKYTTLDAWGRLTCKNLVYRSSAELPGGWIYTQCAKCKYYEELTKQETEKWK